MRFNTKSIHVGQEPEETTGAVVVPIFQTSTYAQPEVGKHKGHEYSRTSNPTRDAYQACIASLENAENAYAFGSGMAAISTIMTLFKAGDHIVAGDDLYGGTFRVFEKIFRDFGLDYSYVDTTNLDLVAEAIRPETKMVWLETPTNPMLKISDIAAISKICKSKGILLGVDNTFMSPFFQRPLDLGADMVMHSSTKYLGGHSDVVGGVVCSSHPEVSEKLQFAQNAMGAVMGPFDAWLTLRGLKTLGLRMERHGSNAMAVAKHLDSHPAIETVIYPGLPSHAGHEMQKQQGDGFGGMVSVRLASDLVGAKKFCSSTKLFFLAESLGGVESLLEHPAIMTHASVPEDIRLELGITDNFVRLSVGVEHIDDLLADLDQALSSIG
ncbi:MAG: cystathionine gamma-lyase [Planctomycetota bacterium]|jgi:cystathionine gamma-lyase